MSPGGGFRAAKTSAACSGTLASGRRKQRTTIHCSFRPLTRAGSSQRDELHQLPNNVRMHLPSRKGRFLLVNAGGS